MGKWLINGGRAARPVRRRADPERAPRPPRAVALAAGCSAVLLAGPARAADINWIDPGGGSFQGPADWSGGIIPGINDAAIFNLSATYALTFAGGPTNQRAEFKRGTVTFDLNTFTYTLTANGIGVRSLAVAEDAGDVATLAITDGTVRANLAVVAPATDTRGTLSVAGGGAFTTTDSVFVGINGGEGNLNVSAGGDVTVGGLLVLGGGTDVNGVGGAGRATVSGAGSTLRVDNQFQVGGQRGGSGELSITSGGSVTSTNSTVIGLVSSGLVTVDGSASLFTVDSTFMTIGSTGQGTLRVRNGGDVVGPTETFIANSPDAAGLLHVTGAGSRFATTDRLTVGRQAAGELLVEAGGVVSNTEGRLGESAGSSGVATVRGAGSAWTTNNAIRVGQAGTGTLRVLNGGTVTSGAASTVGESTGSALVEVRNNGTWTANSLTVGAGSGGAVVNVGPGGTLATLSSLSIEDGGTVNLDGGTLSFGSLFNNGGVLNFRTGTIHFATTGGLIAGGPLGDTVVLGHGQTVSGASTFAVNVPAVLAGGSLSAATLNNNSQIHLGDPASQLSAGTVLNNNALIAGSGRVVGRLANNAAGEVRVSAGERLSFSGVPAGNANASSGRISVLGGDLDFANALVNNPVGTVFLRDGTLTAQAPISNDGTISGRGTIRATQLNNNGQMQLSAGLTDVFAPVTNTGNGRIIVSGAGTASFYLPVTNVVGSEFRVSDDSRAVFFSSVSGAQAFTGGGVKHFEAGSPALGAVQTTGHSVVADLATIGATRFREKSLTVAGRVNIAPGGGAAGTSAVDSLVLAGAPGGWTGLLDLADHAMVVRDGDLALLVDQVKDGRDGSGGITSGLIDARHGVGVIANGTAGDALYDAFQGVGSLEGGEVLLRFTLLGDSDLDGDVGGDDLLRARRSMGGRRPGDWFDGDFDYDGRVTARDMALLRQNLGLSMPAGAALVAGEAAVPEPGAAGLFIAAAAVSLVRRRRQ